MKKTRRKWNLLEIVLFVLLLLYSISMFLPIIFGVLTSLKQILDFGAIGKNVLGLPNMEIWEKNELDYPGNIFGNYLFAFNFFDISQTKTYISGFFNKKLVIDRATHVGFIGCLMNTLLYAGGGSLISAFAPMLAGYLCAMYRNKMAGIVYAIVLFVMATPLVGTQPASIDLYRQLGLYNSILGRYIGMLSFTNMYFLIFYAFFYGLSTSYVEAAEIDGASQMRTMVQICFPLARAVFFTVVLMIFIEYWNDYNTPMLYLPTYPTLAYGIYYVTEMTTGTLMNETPRKVALLMTFALPIVILFIIFREQLMGNLTLGGVKE